MAMDYEAEGYHRQDHVEDPIKPDLEEDKVQDLMEGGPRLKRRRFPNR